MRWQQIIFLASFGLGCTSRAPEAARCASAEAPSPCVLVVDDDVRSPGCGSSWERAFSGVQAAVDQAHRFVEEDPALSSCEVWVAEGTYSVWRDRHSDTLQLRPGVGLYGGFAGRETRRDDRDPAAHPTTLDGRAADGSERVYHVVTGAGDALLDGFTITRGWARSSRYGGGLYSDGASPTVVGCTFEDNHSDFYGGALFASLGEVVVEDCRFVDNSALFGGAIHQQGGTLTITATTFEGNEAEESGGAIAAISYLELFAAESVFRRNKAGESGGALFANYRSEATLEDCVLEDNKAGVEGDDVFADRRSEITLVETAP